MIYDEKTGAAVPQTLAELYAIAEEAYPDPQLSFINKIENFFTHRHDDYTRLLRRKHRTKIFDSLSPEQKEAVYLEHMLNPNSAAYEGFVGNGYTPEQYELFVRNNPEAREMFSDSYNLYF